MIYILDHCHRHGHDLVLFQSRLPIDQLPPDKELAEMFGLDFEPHLEEDIEIRSAGEDPIIDLDGLMLQRSSPQ